MVGLTHKGWRLDYEEDNSPWLKRNVWIARHEDGQVEVLQVSAYTINFQMTWERFCWLVDHDFPHAPSGGSWLNDSIREAMHVAYA